jgi:hypothetical protein
MELDWNFVGGNGRCSLYVDGVAYVSQTTIVCNRGAAPNLGFGDHMYRIVGCAQFKIRDIQMFKTEQHSAASYVVAPLTSTVITSAGIIAPAATIAGAASFTGAASFAGTIAVPAPSADTHAVPRSYAAAIAPVTSVDAVMTFNVTSMTMHFHFLNTSGLVTCHFSTLGAAGTATEGVTTMAAPAAIPVALVPAAGYAGASAEFKVGSVWYRVVFATDRSISLTRTPAWAFGDDLNTSGTVTYHLA